MKIEGFGQVNPMDAVKAGQAQTEASGFESALQKAFDERDKAKLREACNEFEAEMLKMLYKQMKATVPDTGLTEKSSAREMFEDMLDETLMEKSSQRGMGISEMMYKQLSAKMDRTYRVKSETKPNAEEPAENEAQNDESRLEPDGAESVEK